MVELADGQMVDFADEQILMLAHGRVAELADAEEVPDGHLPRVLGCLHMPDHELLVSPGQLHVPRSSGARLDAEVVSLVAILAVTLAAVPGTRQLAAVVQDHTKMATGLDKPDRGCRGILTFWPEGDIRSMCRRLGSFEELPLESEVCW